jgi:predicted dehydrogenase
MTEIKLNRRSFCAVTSSAFFTGGFAAASSRPPKRRIAVIGHTGRGNFGHGLDRVWLKIPEAEIVAVADGNSTGLSGALRKLNLPADHGHTDYRAMLEEVRPEFVAICPRHADQHCEMALAAIHSGTRGLYIEKPFVRSPSEADRLIDACEKHDVKIAVAHRNRYHPVLEIIDQLIARGDIGQLLEIRGRGKGDRRGGGEDLWVLGTHVMNLMQYFGGKPQSCSAVMLQNGRPVTREDVIQGAEGLGPLAGNELHARYQLAGGTTGYFDSIANDGTRGAGFGLQVVGSDGIVNIRCDKDPLAHFVPGNPFRPTDRPRPWIAITTAGIGKPETSPELVSSVHDHTRAVRDLIESIDANRQPICNAREGLVTVEMCCAVFESHRLGGKAVSIPLGERGNALSRL